MEPAHIIALIFLSASSVKDLRTMHGFTDKTYITSILLVATSFLITQGIGTAGASITQAIMALVLGILLRLLTRIGGADIWTLALISSTFPHQIIIQIFAYSLIPMVIWVKIYGLTGREKAPAIPGLTAGLILAITAL